MINTTLPNKIAIIGIGLIGGSIALGLRKRCGNKITIVGSGSDPKRSKLAKTRLIVDEVVADAGDIPVDTQLIILATPVQAVINILTKLAKTIKHPALIIDVGSTKKVICHHSQKILPAWLTFIGTHPLAGKENSGFEAAEANLFRGKPWIICSNRATDKNQLLLVKNLVKVLGSKPMIMDPVQHDQLAAFASHLPLVLTSILVSSVSRQPLWGDIAKIASTGFRDTTRLASQDPEMKRDIILSNKQNILTALNSINKEINKFSELIAKKRNRDLLVYLEKAKNIRDHWLRSL